MTEVSVAFGMFIGWFVNKRLSYLENSVCASKMGSISLALLMGLTSLFFYEREGLLQGWFLGVIFSAFLLEISLFDYYQGLILNKILFLMALMGLVINYFCFQLNWTDIVFSALLGSGFLALLCWISHGGIGGGDIKFVGVLGIWLGWQVLFLAIFLAFVSGALMGILLIFLKQKQRHDTIPFGPFLAGSAFLSYVWGKEILDMYVVLFL